MLTLMVTHLSTKVKLGEIIIIPQSDLLGMVTQERPHGLRVGGWDKTEHDFHTYNQNIKLNTLLNADGCVNPSFLLCHPPSPREEVASSSWSPKGGWRVRLGKALQQRVVVMGRLPRAVITSPGMLEFEKCFDDALRNRVSILGGPVWGQELGLIPADPFQLNYSMRNPGAQPQSFIYMRKIDAFLYLLQLKLANQHEIKLQQNKAACNFHLS